MDKKLIQDLKQKLEKEEAVIEKELKSFAKKDSKPAGDWDTRYPDFDSGRTDMESEADEVQAYGNLLPVEHSLELRFKDIKNALMKIGNSGYGTCEKCGKEINQERLLVCPEAKFCSNCK